MSSITPSRGRQVCPVLLSLLQAQLGEHGYAIRIRHIALHVLSCDDILKFRNQWNQADIAIDDFLKPPQFGLTFRRASGHGDGLIDQSLDLVIAIPPSDPDGGSERAPVEKGAPIMG